MSIIEINQKEPSAGSSTKTMTVITTTETPCKFMEDKTVGRLPVHDLRDLDSGDHIAWWRPEGYWHHALLDWVNPDTQQLYVVHYNGPSPNGSILTKGEVMEEMLYATKEKGLLYKIRYYCKYDTKTTLARARSRLGEGKYNILFNNCEQYVRWCKTGSQSCVPDPGVQDQVQSFYWTVFRIIQKVFTCLSKDVAKFGVGRLATDSVHCTLLNDIGLSPVVGLQGIAWPKVALFCEYLGIALIILIELLSTSLDLYRSCKLFRQGYVSKADLVAALFRRASQGVGGATGAVTGAILGQMYCPLPVIGGLLGSTLGAVLGHCLGHFEGYAFASIQRKLLKAYSL